MSSPQVCTLRSFSLLFGHGCRWLCFLPSLQRIQPLLFYPTYKSGQGGNPKNGLSFHNFCMTSCRLRCFEFEGQFRLGGFDLESKLYYIFEDGCVQCGFVGDACKEFGCVADRIDQRVAVYITDFDCYGFGCHF